MPTCRKKPNSKEKLMTPEERKRYHAIKKLSGEKPRKGSRKGSKKGSSKEEVEIVEVFPAGTKIKAEGGMYTIIKRLDIRGEDIGVYQMKDDKGKREFAMKVEASTAEEIKETTEFLAVKKMGLSREVETLKDLAAKLKEARSLCFMKFVDRGQDTKNVNGSPVLYRAAIFTMAGPTIDYIRKHLILDDFQPHTAATICLSLLEALRTIHGVGIIHQLLKPGHLAIRLEDMEVIALLDFSCARRFRDEDGKWIPPKKNSKKFFGILPFAPRSVHKRRGQYPKDEMESWVFIVLDLHRRKTEHNCGLPWYPCKKMEEVGEMKEKACPDLDGALLAQRRPGVSVGMWAPRVNPMMAHLDSLKDEEMPDYDLLRKHLEAEYTAKGNADWTTPPEYIRLLQKKPQTESAVEKDEKGEEKEKEKDRKEPKEKAKRGSKEKKPKRGSREKAKRGSKEKPRRGSSKKPKRGSKEKPKRRSRSRSKSISKESPKEEEIDDN